METIILETGNCLSTKPEKFHNQVDSFYLTIFNQNVIKNYW